MNEIEYKLESNNPVLITHGISKIFETVKKKITNDEKKDPFKIPELNLLFTKCKCENSLISSVACQAVVCLVETGLLEISSILSQFIATIGETKNYLPITSAICDLLKLDLKFRNSSDVYVCPFFIKAPQHPLITVLMQKNDVWRDILGHMQSMIHQSKPEFLGHYVELLRPVFVYILCNPTSHLPDSCKQQAWHLLMRTDGTIHLQLEILQWLRMNDTNSCVDTSNRVLELAEYAIAEENTELCSALMPLVAALALELLKHNADPRANFVMIETLMDHVDCAFGSIMVFLLAEMIVITPSIYLMGMVQIGSMILEHLNCSETSAYSLIASILPWMAYASLLSCSALDIAKDLITSITEKSDWPTQVEKLESNKFYTILHHVNPNYQFYGDVCGCINSFNNNNLITWLEKVSESSKDNLDEYRLVLCGLFLQTKLFPVLSKIAKILSLIVKDNTKLSSNVLSLILYKLSITRDIEETKELLFTLPDLAISKENLPTIIHTLDTLFSGDPPLKYVAVELYLRVWKIEPRCYRHLLSALVELSENDHTFVGTLTCANTMKIICETRPEQGAELVPLLSQILNKGTTNTGAASALALRGISALCVSDIADICSVWRALSPRMNEERRTTVIKSMCEFFQDIPSTTPYNEEEFNELLADALTKLWEFGCYENREIAEAAFKGLSAYTLDQLKISYLPVNFTKGCQSDAQQESTEISEDKLTYIPGYIWVKVLENIHVPSRKIAGNLIIKFITDELYNYRSGIYMWPMGEPVNYKYLPEKSPARHIGEYLRRYTPTTLPERRDVAIECMRIFSQKYLKALPPIQWKLLANAINISDETQSYGVSLACHQAVVSPSAKEYLSKYLTDIAKSCSKMTQQEFNKCWHVCTHFEDIARGVTSNILAPFIEASINYVAERAIIDNENAVSMFNELMRRYANALKDDLVHHDNKTLIANTLEKVLNKVDIDNKIFPSIVSAMLELPTEQIERLTLPSVWDNITNEKLEKAIEIRGGLVIKRDNEIPLSWMNEILRVASKIPSVHKRLLKTMQKIQSRLRDEKSNACWSWDLMSRIQATIVDTTDNKSTEAAEFLCDVLFITVIVLASHDCLLVNEELIATSHEVRAKLFPHAVVNIVEMSHWRDYIPQIMEWLHLIRTSSLPLTYKCVFHNALISLKKERHLNEHWTKYFSIKGPIIF